MKKVELLTLLSEKVSQCTKCPELVASRTRTVMSSGTPYTKLLFVAEGPGRDEDEKGEVLIGRAGKHLTKMLNAVGINREEIYLCNIVKCRPPNNRKPTGVECNNCDSFLKMQIQIVNPQIIVCLGGTAAQHLLKTETPISHLRKQWFDYKDDNVNAKVFCTFHPSYAVRGNAATGEVIEDFKLLVEMIIKGT